MEANIELYPVAKENRLQVRIGYNGKYADISLGEKVNDYDIDKNRKCVSRKCNRKKEFETKINETISVLEDIFDSFVKKRIEFSASDIKNTYKKRIQNPLKIDEETLFFKAFEQKIESCMNNKRIKGESVRVSSNTAKGYRSTMTRFKAYCSMVGIDPENVTFSDLNYQFMSGFVEYVKKYDLEKGRKGTLATHLKNFRHIVNTAIRNKVLGADKDILENLPRLSVAGEVKDYTLTVSQVMAIINYPAENEAEQMYIDLFAFSYFGCGIANIDISYLRMSDIVNNEIIISRWKTIGGFGGVKGIEQRIVYSSELKVIAEKYCKMATNDFMFPIIDKCKDLKDADNKIALFFQRANRFYKKILPKLREKDPLFPTFTFYDARHAYITHCYEANVPPHITASGAGNSVSMQNKRYLHTTQQSRLDGHNRMQEYRLEQMNAV
ncbi:tyrosine-type recombinase/integrase [Parabacteroides sp.]